MSGINIAAGIFSLPTLHYFKERNKYSGSADKIFRYKITPSDALECVVWYGLNAIDSIADEEIKGRESFQFTEEGRLEMIKWLDERYIEFTHQNTQQADI